MKNVNQLILTALITVIFSITTFSESPKPVELAKINGQIWVHTSYQIYNGIPTPSNGLVIITKKGLVMVDTCWDNEQTKELLKIAQKKFQQKFVLAIITHAHADRIGGIDALLKEKIEVTSTRLTAQKAKEAGYQQPLPKLDAMPNMEIGNVRIETYYPGEGHTQDNITVWFPDSKVLFAGCFVKSMNSKNLGSITDANLKEWPNSLKNLLKKYSGIHVVIPGHGSSGDMGLIHHTLELFGF